MMKNIANKVYNMLKNYYNAENIEVYYVFLNKIRVKFHYEHINVEFVYKYKTKETLPDNVQNIIMCIEEIVLLIYKKGIK